MPSPTTLLAGLVALLVALAGGFWAGLNWEQGREAKRTATAQAAVIEQATETAKADTKLAGMRVERNVAAESAARTIYVKGVTDANLKADPDCRRDAESLGLLNDAIDVANRQSSAGRVHAGVPAAAGAD